MNRRTRAICLVFLLLPILPVSGCVKGSALHKATVGQHTLRELVGAFQDAEIAEHDKGFVPNDLHVKFQTIIGKTALAAIDLDNAATAGASATDLKAKFDKIYGLLDSLNTDGILGVKNPTSKQILETALDGIKAFVDNLLIGAK